MVPFNHKYLYSAEINSLSNILKSRKVFKPNVIIREVCLRLYVISEKKKENKGKKA